MPQDTQQEVLDMAQDTQQKVLDMAQNIQQQQEVGSTQPVQLPVAAELYQIRSCPF